MKKNYYTHIWELALPVIMQLLQESYCSKKTFSGQMPEEEFKKAGNRKKYSFTVTYSDGFAPPKDGSAVCRDLQGVIESHQPFIDFAKGKTITFRLDKYFRFHITCNGF